jgi:nucleoside-diphosphate-sugar epimerase
VKTLITGGTGFVGLNVAEELLRSGEDVVLFSDRELMGYALQELSKLPGTLTTVAGDIADCTAINTAFTQHQPDRVVHAAVITAGEQRELRDFDRIIDVNIKGTGYVLAAAAKHGTRKVVYVSSGSAYGLSLLDGTTVSEETPAQPDTLYSVTKYTSERVCARFRQLCALHVVCARLGSVFGPWEHDTGVRDSLSLPFQIVHRAMADEEVVLPRREPRRDWIYSRDAATAIVHLLCSTALRYDLYNVACGAEWLRFAERCCIRLRSIFPQLRYRIADADEAANIAFLGESDRALMSNERLSSDTGFRVRAAHEVVFDSYVRWLDDNRRSQTNKEWPGGSD